MELIRELPSGKSGPKRTLSGTNLAAGNASDPSMAKTSTSAKEVTGTVGSDERAPAKIEWLMVTRSDPGGSVPRFMVEKGTPPGIVNDAGKFLNWLTARSGDDKPEQSINEAGADAKISTENVPSNAEPADASSAIAELPSTPVRARHQPSDPQQEPVQTGYGLYDMITGAFGAATSAVSGGFGRQFSTEESGAQSLPPEQPAASQSPPPNYSSDASSIRSFTSALEKSMTQAEGNDSIHSSQSDDHSASNGGGGLPQEKELRKLQERRRKLEEKTARMQEKLESKRNGDREKDAAALAKVREKHEREIAKQEAKYRRETKRLEEKREQEERRAEERRRKAAEREERSSAKAELERVRAERDLALKSVELLESQVGELQGQNTMLVAKLGRLEAAASGLSVASRESEGREDGQGTPSATK